MMWFFITVYSKKNVDCFWSLSLRLLFVCSAQSVVRLSRSPSEAVQEQGRDMWNGKSDNDRFILFPVSMTDMDPDALF